MDKDVLHFDSINKLATKLMMTVATVMSGHSSKDKKNRISLANFCQELAEKYMHYERIKKVILDFFGKEFDDNDYNLSGEQADNLIKKLVNEIKTVTQISLAAEDKLDMAWDSEKQDFVFINKEGNKDVSSSNE